MLHEVVMRDIGHIATVVGRTYGGHNIRVLEDPATTNIIISADEFCLHISKLDMVSAYGPEALVSMLEAKIKQAMAKPKQQLMVKDLINDLKRSDNIKQRIKEQMAKDKVQTQPFSQQLTRWEQEQLLWEDHRRLITTFASSISSITSSWGRW